MDRFTRYFIIKTIQVIVQSRIACERKNKTECKPGANDWFNINISDIPEVSERTKLALDPDGFSVRTNWRVYCEISIRTKDGGRVVLEHWIISNKSSPSSSLSNLHQSKLNLSQAQSKSNLPDRSSPINLNSNKNTSSLANSPGQTRIKDSIDSNNLRSRLNSLDEGTNEFKRTENRLPINANHGNHDIKSSTSCCTLSVASPEAASNNDGQLHPSPRAYSLAETPRSGQSNNPTGSNSQAQGPKNSGSSSIYTIYNRMSLLLKTVMTTAHILPAYGLATKTSTSDSCVICYRIYGSSSQTQRFRPNYSRGSLEDIKDTISESPGKRSSFSSNSSLNIRQLVGPDELDHFCPILKLGSIKTDVNELDVSLCYRTDVWNSINWVKDSQYSASVGKILGFDQDCITAAKQLLAGHERHDPYNGYPKGREEQIGTKASDKIVDPVADLNQPLRPAFADEEQKLNFEDKDLALIPIPPAYEKLLDHSGSSDELVVATGESSNVRLISKDLNDHVKMTETKSDPIQVPSSGPAKIKQYDLHHNISNGSTPKSLTDSYVFVELNPPFASEEQSDINSFFYGSAPAFSSGLDSLKDVDELTHQLASIEANASQIDEFVDNICVSEGEEAD